MGRWRTVVQTVQAGRSEEVVRDGILLHPLPGGWASGDFYAACMGR